MARRQTLRHASSGGKSLMVAPFAKGQRTPSKNVIYISDDEEAPAQPKTPAFTIYIDDDSPRPKKRVCTPPKQLSAASSSDYGGSSDKEVLLATFSQIQLMRSWVDCGIQMAIDEMTAGNFNSSEKSRSMTGQENVSSTSSIPVPATSMAPPTPLGASIQQLSQHAGSYMTPPQNQNMPPQYYAPNSPPFQQVETPQGHYQRYPAAAYSQQGLYHVQGPQPGVVYPPHRCQCQHEHQYPPQYHFQPSQHTSQYANQNSSQYLPHNPAEHLPRPYYVTPYPSMPSIHPPSSFSSSASAQSCPTPETLPHTMLAFHTGTIPTSSSANQTICPPLTPASRNTQAAKPAANGKVFPQLLPLPADQYLSWYELEHRYCPVPPVQRGPRNHTTSGTYKEVRLAWLQELKMDTEPYQRTCVADYKKQEVEDAWAGLPATKRREVETLAIKCNFAGTVEVPLRAVAVDALPLPFRSLETRYFSCPERKLSDFQDFVRKRKAWLIELGLYEAAYHTLCSTKKEEVAVETLYSKEPVIKRRSIEARAAFLKMRLNPPKPTWEEFEGIYCIHKRSEFARKADYKEQRAAWLQGIGMDYEPFSWEQCKTTVVEIAKIENTEVAWHELGPAKRTAIKARAKTYNMSQTLAPLQKATTPQKAVTSQIDAERSWTQVKDASWTEINKRIGFKLTDVGQSPYELGIVQNQWLKSIGMGRELKAGETRDNIWERNSAADREAIYRLAVTEKTRLKRSWEVRMAARTPAKSARASNSKMMASKKPSKFTKS